MGTSHWSTRRRLSHGGDLRKKYAWREDWRYRWIHRENKSSSSLGKWMDLSTGSEGSELDIEAGENCSSYQKTPPVPLGHLRCRGDRERMSIPTCVLKMPGMQEAWGMKTWPCILALSLDNLPVAHSELDISRILFQPPAICPP